MLSALGRIVAVISIVIINKRDLWPAVDAVQLHSPAPQSSSEGDVIAPG